MSRVEGLPFGTRGGMAIRSYFPLDAEYEIQVELAGAARDAHQLEITVDGERKQLVTDRRRRRTRRGAVAAAAAPTSQYPHSREGRSAALIGVTFVQNTEALDEATLRPRQRSRGTQPAIASVTIRGPYNATGPGETPSRRTDLHLPSARTPPAEAGLRQADSVDFGCAGRTAVR